MLITSVPHYKYDNLTELNEVYSSLYHLKNVCNTTNKNDVCPSIGVYNGDNFELNIFVGYLPFNPIQGNFDFDIVVVFRDFTTDENLEFVFDSVELQEAILKFKQLYNTYFN